MTGTAALENLKHECQNTHLTKSPQHPVPYHLQCLADLEQVSPCCRKHQMFHQDGDEKFPPRRGTPSTQPLLSSTWSTQKEGVLYTDTDSPYTFQPVPHIPFKIKHISRPQKTVLSQLRNITPLAGSTRTLQCLMQALKNMEGVRRYLSHARQPHIFTCAAITTLSSQEGPRQPFTPPVKTFKTISHM